MSNPLYIYIYILNISLYIIPLYIYIYNTSLYIIYNTSLYIYIYILIIYDLVWLCFIAYQPL